MSERGVIAIAKSVLWSKETMMALIPEDNGIRMQTLFYQNQIKYVPIDEIRRRFGYSSIRAASLMGELSMAQDIQNYSYPLGFRLCQCHESTHISSRLFSARQLSSYKAFPALQ